MKGKFAKESLTITTEHVLPNDTNHVGGLFGGRLMQWMDTTTAISAHRHCKRVVVTAAVNNISFDHQINAGSIVPLEAKVSRAFNSSMEVFIVVSVEDEVTGAVMKCNEAMFTFVAVDQNGSTIPVPELIPETIEDMALFEGALRRRQLRLILGGKMKPDDATELKALFFGESND